MSLSNFTYLLFYLLIFSFGFMMPSLAVGGFALTVSDFLFPFVFAVWFLAVILKKIEFRFSRIYLPFIFFLAAMLVSAIFSQNKQTSFAKLLGIIYLVSIAILVFNLVRDEKTAKKTILVWLAATFIVCLFSLISLILFYTMRSNLLLFYTLSHFGSIPPGNFPRIQATFQHPNMLCNYLNVGLIFSLIAFYFGWIKTNFLVIFWTIFAAASFFTFSPGFGGILLSFGIWLWLYFNQKNQILRSRLSFGFGILAALFFFGLLLIELNPFSNPQNCLTFSFLKSPICLSNRIFIWELAIETFLKYPIFGQGIGLNVVNFSPVLASGKTHFLGDAHQMWLNLAGQAGIFGLVAICGLCYFLVRLTLPFNFEKSATTIFRVSFGIAFIGAFLYQGLGGSFEDSRHLWALVGLIISSDSFLQTSKN